jgi:hypothetical protein
MQTGVGKWEAAGFLVMTPGTPQRNHARPHPDHLRKAAETL